MFQMPNKLKELSRLYFLQEIKCNSFDYFIKYHFCIQCKFSVVKMVCANFIFNLKIKTQMIKKY